jgi:hypothetical protein
MGLDNIPKKYPCIDVAIKDQDGRIDCVESQACGKCTWKNEYESNPMVKDSVPTVGIMGTDCWYRGKYGNGLISMIDGIDDMWHESSLGISFYGNGFANGDEGIDPDECFHIANVMKDNAEKFAFQAKQLHPDNYEELIKDWMYATWWLEFAGEFCEGSAIWY